MIRYAFKDKPLTVKAANRADPQKWGEALARIREQHDGHLRARDVWRTAKDNPRNPLHKHFEWDVQKAAEAHWTETARTIIRSITVEDSDGEMKPAYFSVNQKSGTSYRSYEDVMESADLQFAVLQAAERDLRAWEARYHELEDICDIVRDARLKVADRIAQRRLEAQPSA